MLAITREADIPPLPPLVHASLSRALQIELALPPPDRGEVYLMEPPDTDDILIQHFGSPLASLPFERVIHFPEHFHCYFVRNNSRCDTLVVPDTDWLNPSWRSFLVSQL